MCRANERRCYNVTSSLIGLAHSMTSGAARYERGYWLHRKLSKWKIIITMMSHDHHGISIHWQLDCLFNSCPLWYQRKHQSTVNFTVCSTVVHSDIKGNIKALDNWPFVNGIHWWPVDSPHKGPVMWKVFPYRRRRRHDISVIGYVTWQQQWCSMYHVWTYMKDTSYLTWSSVGC